MLKRLISITPLLGIVIILFSGCAGKPYAQLHPIQQQQAIQVISKKPGVINMDVDGAEAIAKGMGGGAVGGASLGFIAGFECGPLFVICSPIGMITGTAVGGIAGGVVGAVLALPEDKEKALNDVLSSTFQQIQIDQFLMNSFSQKASKIWLLNGHDKEIIVTLKVENFYFTQHSNDELTMRLSASIVVTYPELTKAKNTKRYLYPYSSEQHHVDYWIEKNGHNLHQQINEGIESISLLMVESLQSPPKRFRYGIPVTNTI